MKRIIRSISSVLLVLIITLGLAGCQSTASVSVQDVPAIVLPGGTAQSEEAVPAKAEDTEKSYTYTYAGYELTAVAGDGYVDLLYPEVVTDSDAAAFFASEVAKYGSYLDGVTYSFIDGGARIALPQSADDSAVKEGIESLFDDLDAYLASLYAPAAEEPAPEAVAAEDVHSYSYAGYSMDIVVGDGYADLICPSVVTDDDIASFFAYEVEKYGSYIDGITYTLTDNGARLNIPSSVDRETVNANADNLFADVVEYVESLFVVDVPVEVNAEDVHSYSYSGYSMDIVVGDGYADLICPSVVTDDDIASFFAYEVEKYGSYIDGITYTLTDNGARLNIPSSVDRETVNANADNLFADVVEYVESLLVVEEVVEITPAEESVPAAEPDVYTCSYAGYSMDVVVADGYVDLIYPSVVTENDVVAFFAFEVEKYGSFLDGVVYSFTDDGVRLSLPEGVTREDVEACVPFIPEDIAEFVASLAEPVPEPAVVEEVAESAPAEESVLPAAAPEPVVYPFGIEPVVKNAQGDKSFDLFIVHTNDVHGRINEGEDGSMGYAKLSTLLSMARSITDNILLLDAGDVFHGTNLANIFSGQTVAELLSIVGYDAVAPGNHDFNYGTERLEEIAAWAEDNGTYRILSANITDEDGYLIFQPYQIYDFNGFKVCVIGLTTPDTKTKSHPKNTEGIEFLNDVVLDNAQYAIDLAHEISDFVIVLGHLGVVPDGETGITSEYVCQNLDGIDLFIDGHSHTVMDGGEVVNGTVITSTGMYLENLGVVQIHVEDGEAEIDDVFLIPAADVIDPASSELFTSLGVTSIPADPEVLSYVEEKEAELDERFGTVIAELPMALNGERADVRTKKTNLSKLLCEAMTAESGADFTIVNGGGIRASLNAGPVTIGDVNNVLPFTNIITVCTITPADVYKALEHGYSMLPEQNGAFSQTDLSVVYSASAPAGERIKKVILNGTVLDRNDSTTEYRVATNDFMAAGGDGYTMFGNVLTEGSMLNEVFMSYLSSLYPAR